MNEPLTMGNAAKLYCLERVDELADSRESLRVIDLGCGDGSNFTRLLQRHRHVRYTGVEPSARACERAKAELDGLSAEVVNAPAYDLDLEPADVVVSFSVLEHVYRRLPYLRCAKRHLARDGLFLINYDAGHFVNGRQSDRWKTRIGGLLARFGLEGKYQAPVGEKEFSSLSSESGFRIVEEKVFNTDLKSVYKVVPEGRRAEYMRRWLDFELYVNELGIPYTDELAPVFRTRNFVLTHAA